ncbi:MAG: hypothetical protein E7199_07550 [Schwartzia succinivorans]|nr:hypothetical protein [Schwartzia succinivorans]
MKNSLWKFVPLEQAVNIFDTVRQPINRKERMKRIENKEFLYPYYGATGQVDYIDDYLLDGEYILLGEDGAPFLNPLENKAYIVNGKFWVNNHAHILQSKTNNKFLCYYLNTVNYKALVTGTTRYKLTQAAMKRIIVPVPPLPEQELIVAHIEELFSELDAGVETLKKTKAQLDVYRQAVLKEAFESCTEKRTIKQMSTIVTSGSRGWAKYYSDEGARFIRITDLTRNGISLNDEHIKYVSLPENIEGTRSRLQPFDVLVSITADLGSIALVPQNITESYINQHIAMIRFNNPRQGEFMAWYLRSDYGQKELLKNKRGAGKLGLGLDDIRTTTVPVVTDETAKEILSEIESRLSVCNNIEQTIDAALDQAKALRHSILKEAFEGEPFDEKTATPVRN